MPDYIPFLVSEGDVLRQENDRLRNENASLRRESIDFLTVTARQVRREAAREIIDRILKPRATSLRITAERHFKARAKRFDLKIKFDTGADLVEDLIELTEAHFGIRAKPVKKDSL